MRGITKLFGRIGRRGLFGLFALILLVSQFIFVLPVQAEPVTLSGHITDSANNQPIPNASIKLLLGTNVIGERISDASGAYAFSSENPVPISVTVSVSAIGYQTDASNTVNLGQSVTLNVALDPGLGQVSGVITGADTSLPIPGATIKVLKGNVVHASVQTDANGSYATSPLHSPESYMLQIFPPAGSPYQIVTENISVSGNVTRDKVLPTGTVTLSGVVKTFDDGTTFDPTHPYDHQLPIENATVQILDAGTETVVSAVATDADGNYSLTFTPQNFYDIQVLPAASTPPGGGSEQTIWRNQLILSNTTHNFNLNHENPKISGRVIDNNTGQPISGANVQLYWAVVNGVNPMTGSTFSGEFTLWSRVSDTDGRYTFGIPGDFPIYQNRTYFVRVAVEGEEPVDSSIITPVEDTVLADIAIDVTPPDSSPPTIIPNYSSSPNQDDWYNSPVTITWTVTDPESDISSQENCDPVTVESDTAEITFTCTATSEGGTTSESVTIKYDATAPELDSPDWSANPLDAGNDTTLTVPVSDPTSGVAEGEYFIGSDPGQGNGTPMALDNGELSTTLGAALPIGTHTIHIRARDNAGNWSQVTTTELVVQDVTPPVVDYILSAQPNANGWYSSDVTIDWQATDPAPSSGIPTDPPDTVASTEGANVTYTSAQSCDPAGNCATGSVQLSIDKTNPTVGTPTMSGIVTIPILNISFLLGNTTNITAAVGDNLSGVVRAEYYFDTDPGQGNGATMNLSGSPTSGTAAATANVTGLGGGQHALYIRSQDASGRWSTIATRTFLRL